MNISKEAYERCLKAAKECKEKLEECQKAQIAAIKLCAEDCAGVKDVDTAEALLKDTANLQNATSKMGDMIKSLARFIDDWPV